MQSVTSITRNTVDKVIDIKRLRIKRDTLKNHGGGEYDHYLLPIFFASRFHCGKLEYYYRDAGIRPEVYDLIDNLLTTPSMPRNRLLADILAKTGIVERSGQGMDKIFLNTASLPTIPFIKTSFYSAAKLTILYFMAKQKVLFVIKLNFT